MCFYFGTTALGVPFKTSLDMAVYGGFIRFVVSISSSSVSCSRFWVDFYLTVSYHLILVTVALAGGHLASTSQHSLGNS